MKKLSLIVIVSFLMIQIGCQKDEPQAPQLVYPADSAKFEKLPVTLVWNPSPVLDRYIWRLYITVGVHQDTFFGYSLQDTCYEITGEQFTCPLAFDFSWSVAAVFDSVELWSETRTFTVDRGITGPRSIAPSDGAVFDTLPPTFIWSSDTCTNGFLVNFMNLADSLITFKSSEDTIYEMPVDSFHILANGSYSWWITTSLNGWILSSEMRRMIIQKPG